MVMTMAKFEDFNLIKNLIKATNELGFTDATDVQKEVIPVAIKGTDIIAQAPTGTGKTCAYGLPILNNLIIKDETVQVLILSPTRELAMQITNDLKDYSMFIDGVRIVCLYGGEDITKQITALKKKPQIIVATPGRLIDHLNRHTVKLNNIKTLVLDEADEMLNMGFKEDVDEILKSASHEHQTMLFSATFPKEIEEICYTYLHDAYNIKVKSKSLTVETVKQFYCLVKEKDKIEVMSRLIDLNGYKLVMVFCNTKRAVDDVTSGLLQKGYIVEGLHGDMRQMQRDRVMARFREGLINILVASDVAARGLDVDDVDVVINYDVPEDDEYYIHRIGRTGRAKKQGLAISLVNTNEKFRLRSIINYTKAEITKLEVPELSKVLKVRISRIIQNAIDETMNDSIETAKLKKMISKTVANEIIDKSILAEDIISGLILMQMEDTQDVDIIDETLSKSSKGDNSRLFINLGKTHGLEKRELKILICKLANIDDEDIKTLEMHDDFSFFEVNKKYLNQVLDGFVREKYEGKRVVVEEAKAKPSKSSSSKKHMPGQNKAKSSEKGKKVEKNYSKNKKGTPYPSNKKRK